MDFLFFANMLALLFSFFVVGAILGAAFSKKFRKEFARIFALVKSLHNPILKPGTHPWTTEAVMNPAAAVIGGRTHLLYRAIGMDGVSRLGHASSQDGIVFDNILPYPAYSAQKPLRNTPYSARRYSPVMYPSGGSWGGCEDPRMAVIEGRVYVTFNMFENWMLRVAVISMSIDDFLAGRFNLWDGPTILSHGVRDKNWVLFPEKIGGRFAVLHSIIGDDKNHVRVEYADDLTEMEKRNFESPDPQQMQNEKIAWHYRMRSAGPPPVKTSRGWLVLYHAMDPDEPNKYKLGAMLLDLNDPTKVLCRASAPVLAPCEHYENHGKPGIVYACGAVVRDGTLFVYYGGADKVVCVATAPLDAFIDSIVDGRKTSLAKEPAQTI